MGDNDDRHAAAVSPLPPGFRFRPTDEELLTHYLVPKAADDGFATAAVREVDLYKAEPWDLLPHEAAAAAAGGGGGGEDGCCYFFCRRSIKFPSGLRTNRATRAGYWKSTGKDKVVLRQHGGGGEGSGCPLGVKKTLVFYRGRTPRGDKTSWVMHEYRLVQGHASPAFARTQSEWVICRVFMKKPPEPGDKSEDVQQDQETVLLYPPLDDHLQPAIDGCDGKTPAAATSDNYEHANCFSVNAPTMAPGDHETLGVLQLNHDHQELLMNYAETTDLYAPASPQQAAILRNELAEAAGSFDLLPQLLDYDGFPQDFF